ncbi:MAG: cytochrome c oxidase subunit I, partial [Gammaproteobacteria bacterium]|nr:cytochrome c oxidase subunit I [Gammaproteobacteria bacterium]
MAGGTVSEAVSEVGGDKAELERVWSNPTGWRRLTVVNHSIIGKRFLITAAFFFAVGGVLAMLIRAQLATPDSAFLGHAAYNQVFTMHGTVMMFLFAIPAIEGLALYLLPKMLGARDLAFPRLSAFGYYCYLFGGLILLGALVFGVAPDSGWFMYTPLSGATYTPGINADVWLLGITFVEISAIAIGVELCVTILRVRAAGMSLDRMPLFGWYLLVTAAMILVGFPPLILGSILLEVERAFGWPFFDPTRGGDPLLWQHLFWLFGHPEVYIIFLPAAAIVSTLVPVFARRAIVGYSLLVVSIIATGFISFGLWVHHMFTVGIPHLALVFFSAASMLVALPTTVQVFAWIATLYAGHPVLNVPMLHLFGFLFVFVFGGLTGVMLALVPFNWQVHDTHFVVAHLHYVLVGGFLFPVFAGLYYWLPHISGRMPSQRLGVVAFWLIFGGFNLTFFGMHFTGLLGMPRRIYTYQGELGWDLLNLLSSLGGFVMTIGLGLLVIDLVMHWRFGRPAPRDPWQSGTLEWTQATPPPPYNFVSLPEVCGRDPLWDDPELGARLERGEGRLPRPRQGWQETLLVEPMSGRPDGILRLPGPSWWPLLGALGLLWFFFAFLMGAYAISPLGLMVTLVVCLRWAWDTGSETDPKALASGAGETLEVQDVIGARAPGAQGLVFTLIANGTLLASLLFGYGFLWTVGPQWPPESWIDLSPVAAFGVPALLVLGLWCVRRAHAKLGTAAGAVQGLLLAAATVAAVAAIAFFLLPVYAQLAPQTHAYDAIVAVMAGYAGVHAAMAALL